MFSSTPCKIKRKINLQTFFKLSVKFIDNFIACATTGNPYAEAKNE